MDAGAQLQRAHGGEPGAARIVQPAQPEAVAMYRAHGYVHTPEVAHWPSALGIGAIAPLVKLAGGTIRLRKVVARFLDGATTEFSADSLAAG